MEAGERGGRGRRGGRSGVSAKDYRRGDEERVLLSGFHRRTLDDIARVGQARPERVAVIEGYLGDNESIIGNVGIDYGGLA